MKNLNGLMEVFKIFQDKESYFDERDKEQSNRLIINQILIICLFTFIYGIVMGSYHSILQSVIAGLKVIVLFLTTLIICFPSFFVIQQVLGSKLSLRQMIIIVLSGFVLTSAIAISFSPIVILFQITGGNYHFLQLLHVAVFIFSGAFGMRLMVDALKFACEKKDIYPQVGVTVFRIWIIILAFVGIQLSWNLRPFLSDKNEEFKLFRKYEGNFYTAIVYSVRQLVSEKESTPNPNEDNKQPFKYFEDDRKTEDTTNVLDLLKQ
jgi:glucan phosphoethanolaminetransferase (alkaline phosphatase superfamily)